MFTEGYVCMHRKILNWEWYDDIPVRVLFEHLIYTVNWTNATWHGIEIKAGQRVTFRERLATETGLSEQQVRTALKKLQKTRRNNHQNNQQIYSYNH